MKRVVVTGMGLVTPFGCGKSHNWNSLISAKSSAAKIIKFDPTKYKCQVACEVPIGNGENGTFNSEDWIERKEIKKIDDFIKYAMAAGEEAFQESNLGTINDPQSFRAGCIIGSGMGGLPGIEQTSIDYANGKKISPFFITGRIINMPAGYLSIKYNLKGPNYSTVSACASSAHAIGESFRLIQHGQVDVMMTGGSEATISPIGIEGFTACKALSTKFNDTPSKSSRPFDEERDGFVMGEGAGALVLEEYEHAKARGANILAEVVGGGMAADAYHLTGTHPEGEGAVRGMKLAIKEAGISPDDVDYINMHATSTPIGDISELKALKTTFGERKSLSVSGTKSMTGHLLGAAGAIEGILSVKSLMHQEIPPTINVEDFEPEYKDLYHFPMGKGFKTNVDYALSNTFGFGGHIAAVLFKRFES